MRGIAGATMSKVIIVLMLILVSSNAIAEWTQISYNNEALGGEIVYANLSSIRKNSDMVKMWTMHDYKIAQLDRSIQKTYLSDKILQEFDCKEERIRALSAIYMSSNSGQGDVVSNYNFPNNPDDWQPVTPDSFGEVLWKIACAKQ